ncbi:hypothetical protein PsYK624_130970 [Phanerochaete sordida]|uniref:Uncharacterized protein n=1 Tax=Phanerochaete sordida TaxID=48140 RepID=A0A9P3GP18_9APHY|nr:hypothetical protein PsYK624_130970 [Phanerochaete sordida]
MLSQPPAKRLRLATPSIDENLHPPNSSVQIKWDDVLIPSNYSPLQDSNTPVASTSAVTLDTIPAPPAPTARFQETLRSRTKKGKSRDTSPEPLPRALENGRQKFKNKDAIRRYTVDFSEELVPHAKVKGDRRDLRQWIPAKYLHDGVLAPEGLFIANALTCVRLNNDLAQRHRREGILVVPRGHRDLQEKGKKDMWCLVCEEDAEDVDLESKKAARFNPRISKLDRHAGKPIHRLSIARALGIDPAHLPAEQQYGCPFRGHPECGHKWAERTDVVVKHVNGFCKANPHSLKTVAKYRRVYEQRGGLSRFPDDPRVFVDDAMWRPAADRELRRLEQADADGEQDAQGEQAGAHGADESDDSEGDDWDSDEGDEAADTYENAEADTSAARELSTRPNAQAFDAAPTAASPSCTPSTPPVEVLPTRPPTPPAASRHQGHPPRSAPLPAPRLPAQVPEGRPPPEPSAGHPPAPTSTRANPPTAGSTTPHVARLPRAAPTPALPIPPPPATAYTPTSSKSPAARELEFMRELFDFDAYDAAHEAYLAQRDAEPRVAGPSSRLKRKCSELEDEEDAEAGVLGR